MNATDWADLAASGWGGGHDVHVLWYDGHGRQTVLHWAASHVPMLVPALLALGADPQVRNSYGQRAVWLAAMSILKGSNEALDALLVGVGPPQQGEELLHALALHHPDRLALLVKAGWPVDERDPHDFTPLMRACSSSHPQSTLAVRTLLDAGADPHRANLFDLSAWSIAGAEQRQVIETWQTQQRLNHTLDEPQGAAHKRRRRDRI